MAAAGAAVAAVAVAVLFGNTGGNNIEETTTVATTEAIVQPELPVSEEEADLLSSLYKAASMYDYNGTATILNENEEQFEAMMLRTLKGEKYYYFETNYESGETIREMGKVTASGEFEGMVLTRFNTVFYGEFSNGKPEGQGFAIQAMILDRPRYSYAEGTWSDGKLNGEGRAGYHYYLDAPESGFIRTEKRGIYRDNLLDGTFVYETESGSGERLSWEMKAVNGVTVITQDWEYYPFRKEYMLGSTEDAGRAYVLSENRVATVLWNNLIVWDE